jgi:glycosyltransferase 2 family protein
VTEPLAHHPPGVFRRLLGWGIIGIVFALIVRELARGWHELGDAAVEFRPWILLLSVILLLAYMLGRSLIWHHLTVLTGSSIPPGHAVGAWLSSQVGKYVPGKVFLYLGRLHLYREHGAKPGRVSLAFGLELVATFAASILTVLVSLLTLDSLAVQRHRALLVTALAILLMALHPRILNRMVAVFSQVLRRQAFRVEVGFGSMLGSVGIYILNWTLFGLALFVLIRSFYPLEGRYVIYLAGAFSFAHIAGMLAVFVPSGLGVREGVLLLFLNQAMPASVSALAVLVSRVWFTTVELLAAAAAYIILRRWLATSDNRRSPAHRSTE